MTSENKHTPGPWVAWDILGAGWQIGTKQQFDRRAKGEVVGYGNIAGISFYQIRPDAGGSIGENEHMQESAAADAHLLAAAPELLTACEAVLAWVRTWDPSLMHDMMATGTYKTVSTAVAKAKGVDPCVTTKST